MRTFYNRTAFQLPGDARVRISLDTEVCLDHSGSGATSLTFLAAHNGPRRQLGRSRAFRFALAA